jgi:branched-chain amino acid transport system permease protein
MEFLVSVFIFALVSVVAVAGVYVLTGLTGMFSLGQASFMAIGAYVSGVLVTRTGFPFWLATVAAIVVAVFVGFIVGLPTVRLRRDYIALVTLGFGEGITALLNQSAQLTGGAMGLSGIPIKTTLLVALGSAVVAVALAGSYKVSKYGRQCIAIKSDELAAKAMGINVPRVKMISFLIAVALTAYAGVLYAFYTTYVDPSMFGWKKSAEWVIMVFFGGVNSLTGAIVSTLLLAALPEALRFASEYRMFFYAILVLLIINFKPSGLFGEFEFTPRRMRSLFGKRGKVEGKHAAGNKKHL